MRSVLKLVLLALGVMLVTTFTFIRTEDDMTDVGESNAFRSTPNELAQETRVKESAPTSIDDAANTPQERPDTIDKGNESKQKTSKGFAKQESNPSKHPNSPTSFLLKYKLGEPRQKMTNSSHPAYKNIISSPVVNSRHTVNSEQNIILSQKIVKVSGSIFERILIEEKYEIENQEIARIVSRHLSIADEVVVKFREGIDEKQIRKWSFEHDLTVKTQHLAPRTYSFKMSIPNLKVRQAVIDKIGKSEKVVEYVHNDGIMFSSAIPNDPMLDQQWHHKNPNDVLDFKIEEAWDQNTDCSNILVAVIDSGIDLDHPDLVNNLADAALHRSFVVEEATPDDGNGHGTHVAGIIGAEGNNATGVTGVCWKAKIVAIKALSADGSGSSTGVSNAMNYAASVPAIKVINMSLGGPASDPTQRAAFDNFGDQGKILVVAAGNESNNIDNGNAYPAAYSGDHALRVAAIDINHQMASFSNFGQIVQIAAPGVDIMSTWNGGSCAGGDATLYCAISGTSMASPYAAGIVAQYWSQFPSATNLQVIAAIVKFADKINLNNQIKDDKRIAPVPALKDAITPTTELASLVAEMTGLNEGESIDIQLNLLKRENSITKVELYNGEELIETLTTAPFNFKIKVPGVSDLDLVAKVYDDAGNIFESIAENPVDINSGPELGSWDNDKTIFYLGEPLLLTAKDSDGVKTISYDLGDGEKTIEATGLDHESSVIFTKSGIFDIRVASEDSKGAIKEKKILRGEIRDYEPLTKLKDSLGALAGNVACEFSIIFSGGIEHQIESFNVVSEPACMMVCDLAAQFEISGHKEIHCGVKDEKKSVYIYTK